jgi:N4-gp56 family major capsid protein
MSVFTSTANIGGSVIAAYDRVANFALRAGAVFDQQARFKAGSLTNPGSSEKFLFYDDLAPATTALTETSDVDAVGLSDSIVTVTPLEYGNAVKVTIKLRKQSLSLGFDADVANIVAYNMVDSVENIARIALDASGTQVLPTGVNITDITAANTLIMSRVREQIAALRSASVAPLSGNDYAVTIHPDVAFDLMEETVGNSWTDLKHTTADKLMSGELGRFAGAVFLESPRANVSVGGGSGAIDNYTTYVTGQDALGKAETIAPHVVPGPITDTLMRFMPLGWYGLFGYGEIRSASTRRLITTSSLGPAAS